MYRGKYYGLLKGFYVLLTKEKERLLSHLGNNVYKLCYRYLYIV